MKNTMMLLAIAAVLSACGGGSSTQTFAVTAPETSTPVPPVTSPVDPTPTPPVVSASSAEGLYNGWTSTGRVITELVLDDGSYYLIYSALGGSAAIGGAVVGTGISKNGDFITSDARDINLEGSGVLPVTVCAEYIQKTSFKGCYSYPSVGPALTFFTGTYNPAYETMPTLAAIAGTYSGSAGSAHGKEAATVTVSATGTLSGSGASGCTFTGSIAPRAKGNAYTVTVTSGASPCLLSNASLTGAAYLDSANKRMYAVGLTPTRDDGFIFAGSRP